MPIILTLAAMPVSVGGTGVREWLFVVLLGPLCGVSSAEAKMLSLTGFILMAAWGMIGGLIYLLYRPSKHPKFLEVERQVHEFEHEVAEGEAPDDDENKPEPPDEDEEDDDAKEG
jgi:hypothetical protein